MLPRGSLRLNAVCALFAAALPAQLYTTPILQLDGETSDPTVSPDGKTLAFEWCKPDYTCGIYTRPSSGGKPALLATGNGKSQSANSPRWSPDGRTLAFTRSYSHYEDNLVLRPIAGGQERDLGGVCWGRVAWTPDSKFIVASKRFDIQDCRPTLYSAITGRSVRQLAKSGDSSTVSPDGRMIAYADGKSLKLLRFTAGLVPLGPATTLVTEPREISDVLWTRDGKQLIYQSSADWPYLRRISLQPGARPQPLPEMKSNFSITEFLANGDAIATETTQVNQMWRADLRTSPAKIEVVQHPDCSSAMPNCSPDRRQRALVTMRTGDPQIWLSNADGSNERPLVKSVPGFVDRVPVFPMLAGWSPDGKWIAFTVLPAQGNADLRSNLYIVSASGGSVRQLGQGTFSLSTPAWSPDSQSIYASQLLASEEPTSQLVRIDLRSGKTSHLATNGIWPHPSPNGKFLYFLTFGGPHQMLSRIQPANGAEENFWEIGGDFLFVEYAVAERYVYLFQQPPRSSTSQTHVLIRFDPEKHQLSAIGEIPFRPQSAQLSSDQRFLYCSQQGNPKQQVVLVHGLLTAAQQLQRF